MAFVGFLFFASPPAFAETRFHEKVSVSPEPTWVVPAATPSYTATNSGDASEIHLLYDKQVNAASHQTYVHVVRKVLNSSGVQSGSRINIQFDPSFTALALHHLHIRRGEQVLNRLDLGKLQVLQRESELERYIYNGQLSVLALLEDVRQGDEIDCAYTFTGANPIFDDKFSDAFFVQFPFAVQHFRFRLLWPEQRTLFIRNQETKLEPIVTRAGELKEYMWEATDLLPLMPEPGIPAWYNPYGRVQLSEFGTWEKTATWAAKVLNPPTNLSPELEQQIAQWKSTSSSAEDALLAALRFVQDDIRYLGIEVGKQTHAPTDPSTVFERRFGDCKDKAVLLCAVLNRLGFNASPALVNTKFTHRIEQSQPSPLVFNHVIVRLVTAGETFWLDPTISNQRGLLAQHSIPAYGRALVAEPGTKDLSVVAANSNALAKTIVRESYTIRGSNGPSELRVVTSLEGEDADIFRTWLARSGRSEVEKVLLSPYLRQYGDVTSCKSIEVRDSEKDNKIQTVEHYLIRGLWKDKDGWSKECSLFAESLPDLQPTARGHNSKMPLAVSYPRRHLHIMEIDLPDRIRLQDLNQVIRGPADELRVNRVNYGKSVRLELDYRSLADSVPPEKITQHRSARSEMRDHLAVSLTWTPRGNPYASPKPPLSPVLLWTSIVFGVMMFVIWRSLKNRQELTA